MSTMMAPPPANLLPTTGQQLQKNPMLPGLPQTGNLDSQYLAQEAQLRAEISREYADILQQLGFIDPETGQFIPGSISVAAGRQQQELGRQSDIAADQVSDTAMRGNALSSGRVAVNTERATRPMQNQIAQLGVDTPLALGKLYEQAAGLTDQYTLQNNLYLAAMAARQAQIIASQPGGPTAPTTTTPTTGGGTTTGGGGDQGGGTPSTELPGGRGEPIEQLPTGPGGFVNPNPEAPGQIFVPVTVGSQTSYEPKPNPESYGSPVPDIVNQGGELAPGSQLVGPDEMPKPNPASYGQPIPDMPLLLDTINNAINATPGSGGSTIINSGGQQLTQTNKGKYGKKPLP
jgi:hypothetical protein